MKQSLLSIVFSFLFFTVVFGQDLIVTADDDSLFVRIVQIHPDYILYQETDSLSSSKKTIKQEKLKVYSTNYKHTADSSLLNRDRLFEKSIPRFQFGAMLGYSRLLKAYQNVPEEFSDYYRGLSNGYSFELNFLYNRSPNSAIGLRYNQFKSRNVIYSVWFTFSNGAQKIGKLEDKISIHHIMPYYSFRYTYGKKKSALFADVGVGYALYTNDASRAGPYFIKGKTLELGAFAGGNFIISDVSAFVVQVGYIYGSLGKITIDAGGSPYSFDLDAGDYINNSRLSVEIGLYFLFE